MTSGSELGLVRPDMHDQRLRPGQAPQAVRSPACARLQLVRPYGPRIQQRLEAMLASLGLHARPEWTVPPHATDAEAALAVRVAKPDVLVCPFHAVRDREGQDTHGIRLLRRLQLEWPEGLARLPVLMPVSTYSAAVYEAVLRLGDLKYGPLEPTLLESVLRIDETDLDQPAALAAAIERHVARIRRRCGALDLALPHRRHPAPPGRVGLPQAPYRKVRRGHL